MGRKIGTETVAVEDFAVVFDDRVGNKGGDDPGDQNKEDDAEAFKLAFGFFGEELFHPYGSDLHEHDIAAAEEEQADQ